MGGMHPATDLVVEHLRARGAAGEVQILTDSARTAALAAAQLGVEVGAIANSLVFAVPVSPAAPGPGETGDGAAEPLLILTSGSHRVDTDQVAHRLGVARLDRADPAFVRNHTGQTIGGVAPVGHPRPIRTLVDVALADHPVVWAAAGHPHAVFPTTFDELVRVTDGSGMVVTADG
jgi:prolyl-tRNA editing enzyme YbaK/EbsC (Cys-tRNA(Pro) deacylase)